MSGASKSIRDKINTNSSKIKSVDSPPVKKEKRWSLMQTFLMFFGVELDSIKKGKGAKGSTSAEKFGNLPPLPSRESPSSNGKGNIRDVYSFDPVAVDNMRIYLQGQDGRGDPKECDCDHDERG